MSMSRGSSTVTEASVEELLDLAEDALDEGDAHRALRICRQVLDTIPDHPGATFLSGEAQRSLGELERAEAHYRQVVALTPEHSPSWSALGSVLFEMLRFDEARSCALRAIRLDPRNAEACYLRALLRERRDDRLGARRDYLRAARLEPDIYPAPLELDDATVEAVVEEVLRLMHPSIRAYLANVAILLEEVPDAELCLEFDPPASPSELLGYYTGVSLRERSFENPWSNLPSAIVLFRRNLERIAWDRERLIEELRITVFHEVGHFLGLDEDDLAERGLD